MNGIDPKLDCILVILPSTHSPTGLIMQREDSIMEWIFLAHKQSKKNTITTLQLTHPLRGATDVRLL